ncbi:MAG: aldehyde dehydrogenase family protein, partial [Trebonia sp.]
MTSSPATSRKPDSPHATAGPRLAARCRYSSFPPRRRNGWSARSSPSRRRPAASRRPVSPSGHGVPADAALATREAFAPVVAVTTIGSAEEGIGLANATSYGLQAGVFCQDLDVAFGIARRLRMGGG